MTGTDVDRISAQDATTLATDVGPAPSQVGALLWLDTDDLSIEAVHRAFVTRVPAIPRLRQTLHHLPLGCGRPIWVDDPGFDIRRHVTVDPPVGDRAAVLVRAAALATTRLPARRPLWSATFVPVPTRRTTALIVVFHHVLSDGIGGLAVLAGLVDGAGNAVAPSSPAPRPPLPLLAREALRHRWRVLRRIGRLPATVRAAVAELRANGRTRASRSSLNRPTGPGRAFAVTHADLDAMRAVAHDHGGSVNDVVLAAVAGAFDQLLAHRGERVDGFVVSVPVSGRRTTTSDELGNQVGVAPIELPCEPDRSARLATIVTRGRRVRASRSGASAELLGPLLRTLAMFGCYRWFVDRQRLVNAFVTNLRGPEVRMSLLGAPITEMVLLGGLAGNVTVAFGVLSYAGALGVTIVADPEACPELDHLRAALQEELDAYCRLQPSSASPSPRVRDRR